MFLSVSAAHLCDPVVSDIGIIGWAPVSKYLYYGNLYDGTFKELKTLTGFARIIGKSVNEFEYVQNQKGDSDGGLQAREAGINQ